MKILAFDPGETTGIAVVEGDGFWTMGLTVSFAALNEKLFRSLIVMAEPTVVLIEDLPSFAVNKTQLAAYERIEKWFLTAGYEIHSIQPGQWKGMTGRVKISGTHQMDAATMGVWYWKTRLVNIIK